MPQSTIIQFNNVFFSYNDQPALDNVSFGISSGDYVGLIGPNGGGKTTLLKILLGLLEPTSGNIKLFGTDSRQFKQRNLIGYVPQRVSGVDKSFVATVQEVVNSGQASHLSFLGPKHDHKSLAKQAMVAVGVEKFADRLISTLSGGERQRVFIARALATNPQILVLDEPTVGIDLPSQEQFYTYLCDLNTKMGLTIIFVSHDVDVIAGEVNSIMCLNHKLVFHGSPKQMTESDSVKKLYASGAKLIHHHH